MLVGYNDGKDIAYMELEFACTQYGTTDDRFTYSIDNIKVKDIISEKELMTMIENEILKGYSVISILKKFGVAKKDHPRIISNLLCVNN